MEDHPDPVPVGRGEFGVLEAAQVPALHHHPAGAGRFEAPQMPWQQGALAAAAFAGAHGQEFPRRDVQVDPRRASTAAGPLP